MYVNHCVRQDKETGCEIKTISDKKNPAQINMNFRMIARS